MWKQDLNTFRYDCKRRDEQIAMLQSMRKSQDEIFAARMRTYLQPWKMFSDPDVYDADWNVGHANTNKYIDFHLRRLSECY